MKQKELLLDFGAKATYFGLGMLAAKKLRPYAKYFIIGGIAMTAVPGMMTVAEKTKKVRKIDVEEVVVEGKQGSEAQAETAEATCEECQEEPATACSEETVAHECCSEEDCCSEEKPE